MYSERLSGRHPLPTKYMRGFQANVPGRGFQGSALRKSLAAIKDTSKRQAANRERRSATSTKLTALAVLTASSQPQTSSRQRFAPQIVRRQQQDKVVKKTGRQAAQVDYKK